MTSPNRPWIAAVAASTALGVAACSSTPRAPERVLLEPIIGPGFEPRAFDPLVLPPVSGAARAASAYAGGALGTTHALLGGQQFEDTDFWDPIESNYSIAFDSSYENLDEWVGAEWGGGVYFNDGDRASDGPVTPGVLDYRLDSDLEMYEASLGVRRTFLRATSFRPYVGVGATMAYYEAERIETGAPVPPDTVDYRQQIEHKRVTFGIYAHAGFEVQLGENWMLGLDARALRGTDLPEMFGHGDLDYDRVSFFAGFGG